MPNSAETCPVSWLTVCGKRGRIFSATLIGALCPLLSISRGVQCPENTIGLSPMPSAPLPMIGAPPCGVVMADCLGRLNSRFDRAQLLSACGVNNDN